jgi:protein-S-isoprenylcysteine O-methyltransferase Ste14
VNRSKANWIFVTPFVIAVLVLIKPSLTGGSEKTDWIVDISGLLIAVLGLIIRVVARDWKANRSHLGLVKTGPYAIVRHPMYVASYLSGAGLCIIMGNLYFGIGFSLLYILVHVKIARREERSLIETFEDEYKAYRANVPAVIPNPVKLAGKILTGKPWVSSKKSAILREIGTICGFLTGALLLELREQFYAVQPLDWMVIRVELSIIFVVAAIWVFYTVKRPIIGPISA